MVWSYSGVRSLLDDGEENVSKVTRDYKLYLDDSYGPPVLSVYGGKITTYRTLAEHVVDRLATYRPKQELRSWTDKIPLPGGDLEGMGFEDFVKAKTIDYPRMPKSLLYRYARAYGSRMSIILGEGKSVEALGVHYGDDLYQAEIEYLIIYEFALSV